MIGQMNLHSALFVDGAFAAGSIRFDRRSSKGHPFGTAVAAEQHF